MASAYEKGRAFEYRVKSLLKERGFYVVRSAGSKTGIDLIAGKDGEVLVVQCKTKSNISDSEKESLINIAKMFGAKPIFFLKNKKSIKEVVL